MVIVYTNTELSNNKTKKIYIYISRVINTTVKNNHFKRTCSLNAVV